MTPVSADLIEWADIVFPMEGAHLRRLNWRFPVQMRQKRAIVLNIRDDYDFMDPDLIELLRSRLRTHIEM
ncbi:cellular communication/signal transduction [Granulicella sibirica]|uniref:Cellular communication/signal transduction n=1 Tax=Granulicella sibirica TaxID=2479048 RepID=A0A4Q0T683_9BACT|nr:cellular communication/signal transduction [Granulicella sibirica]